MSGPEARRSPRVRLEIPLAVDGEGRSGRAHTVVVNRYGALILCSLRFPEDAMIKVQNTAAGNVTLCRVAFCGGEDLPGLYKLGIEIMGNVAGFWGSDFESLGALGGPAPAAQPALHS
jgi:hypothetical protein